MKRVWEELVDKDIYRVTTEEYLPGILKKGMDPQEDPFKDKYEDIEKLFQIMLELEKNGTEYSEDWRDGPAIASDIIEFNRESRENNYIDFVPDHKQAKKFCEKWRGGALTNVVYNFTTFLLEKGLAKESKELIEKLNQWAKKKREYANRIITVKGSDKIFETAKMLLLPKGKRTVVESPYGSKEHFDKVTKGKLEQYLPYLKTEELSYLRVTEKIEPGSIKLHS